MNKREWMVDAIKSKYGLNSPRVLDAMLQVPREKFVPRELHDEAYEDRAQDIGHGATISQPLTVAFMTDLLDLHGHERVLEVGTGSGYQAAVLSLLCKQVYSVERLVELYEEAKKRLGKFRFSVLLRHGDGAKGWEEHAPYDRIVITADVGGEIPEALFEQLKDPGIMVAPVKGIMKKYSKKEGKITEEDHGYFRFVPLA